MVIFHSFLLTFTRGYDIWGWSLSSRDRLSWPSNPLNSKILSIRNPKIVDIDMYTYGSVLKLVATPLFIYVERMFHNKPSSYWGTPPILGNLHIYIYIYIYIYICIYIYVYIYIWYLYCLQSISIMSIISVIEENLHCWDGKFHFKKKMNNNGTFHVIVSSQ